MAGVLTKRGTEKDAYKEEGDAGKTNGEVRAQGQECWWPSLPTVRREGPPEPTVGKCIFIA